jgi:hypothetical protein
MFRSLVSCALVAAVAADGHAATAAAKCNSTFHAVGDYACRDIVELGRCFADEGISALPPTSTVRIAAEHELIKAQKFMWDEKNTKCQWEDDHDAENAPKVVANSMGDLEFQVHEKKDVSAFRYKREIVDLYHVTEQVEVLGERCADKVDTDTSLSEVGAELTEVDEALNEEVGVFSRRIGNSLSDLEDSIKDTITDLSAEVTSLTKNLSAVIKTTEKALTEGLDEEIAAMQAEVEKDLAKFEPMRTWANDTGDVQWARNYELVMQEKAPDNTENGHKGRWFYKINFNPNTVGFFYPNREELVKGCKALSEDMKNAVCPNDASKTDGIDRNLKPVCDHHRGDSNSIDLSGSYLSHCGCGSYPRQRSCLGMSEFMLKGTVTYNHQNSWNGCQMLRHDRECHHHWVDCYSRSDVQAIFTICSSANDNKNKGPFEGCE